MVKRLALLLALFIPSLVYGQATVIGTIFDAGGNPATSGTVTFTLQPSSSGIQYFILNVGTVAPQNVVCGIGVTGHLQAANSGNPCVVYGNDVITPANTTYKLTFAPNGVQTNVVNGECIAGLFYNVNAPVFCPIIQLTPQQGVITSNPFQTNIFPSATNVFNIGSPSLQYASIYASQIFANGVQLFPSTNLLPANNTWSGTNTFNNTVNLNSGGNIAGTWTGNANFTGLVTATCFDTFNANVYVGGACAGAWGSGDIGSQMVAAGAALPSSGGNMYIMPPNGGACYVDTTSVVFNTVGKMINITGGAVSSSSGTTTTGTCILYTHITATTFLNVDWCPSTGCSYIQAGAIRDLTILNTSAEGGSTACTTNGGCGTSSAIGITIGDTLGTNGGAQLIDVRNVAVKGFGVGIDMAGLGAGIGWAPKFDNPSLAYNTTGLRLNGTEGIIMVGGTVSVNGTGIKLQNTLAQGVSNITDTGTHFDSNTILAIDGSVAGTCGLLSIHGAHWENLGTSNVNYVNCAGGAGTLNIEGGEALDDSSSGGAAAYWFNAFTMHINGLSVTQGAGRPAPTALFTIGAGGGDVTVNDQAVANIPVANLGAANFPHIYYGNGVTLEIGAPHIQSAQLAAPTCTLGAGFGGAGAGCTAAGSDLVGVISATAGAAPGNSSTVQLNFQKTYTGTAVGCLFEAAGNFAAGVNFQDTTPTNTTDLFTVNNNGVAFVNATVYKILYHCIGHS